MKKENSIMSDKVCFVMLGAFMLCATATIVLECQGFLAKSTVAGILIGLAVALLGPVIVWALSK